MKVLYISGYSSDVAGEDGPSSAYLGKPFAPYALVAKVRELLGHRDQRPLIS
jgi:hypothetical protein